MSDQGESQVSDDELPSLQSTQPNMGVGFHVEQLVREKIVQGRYIAFASLLPSHRAVNRLVFDKQRGTISTVVGDRKLYSFSEWTDAFLIYQYIRMEAHPNEAIHLVHYQQTIKRIHDRGGNFVAYDEAFRCKLRGKVPIPWQGLDDAELSWAVTDPSFTQTLNFNKTRNTCPPAKRGGYIRTGRLP